MAKKPELLSPAGSPEALRAAVEYGADAVYLGCGAFNARRGAKNFSVEDFSQAVVYCHLRGVKVYLTLNTLVSDRELPAALETAALANRLGVDAILVQDFGLFSLLRSAFPDQPLHASTQMSIFTSAAATRAAEMGCERVVLARELSASEIGEICSRCPAEVEAFAHGALCMCYSGQCAMSAVLGGRSGNRGTCAQPCRLPYQVVLTGGLALEPSAPFAAAQAAGLGKGSAVAYPGEVPSKSARSHPLSLKDSSLAGELAQAAALGVACLKLEGRMKRPEYVAVITDIYARLLREDRVPSAEESQLLEAAFSRSGFTQGYWQGQKGAEMFGIRPENSPEPKELFATYKAGYEKGGLRTVPISLSCYIGAGKPASLSARDEEGHSASVSGPVPEVARRCSITEEDVKSRLAKTGGTAFFASQISARVEEGLSLSAAALNALRREALGRLEEERLARPQRRELPLSPSGDDSGSWPHEPGLTVSLFHPQQLSAALLDSHPERVYLPLERLSTFAWQSHRDKTAFFAILPRVWRDGDEALLRQLLSQGRDEGLRGVLLGNLGHLPLTEQLGLDLAGDYGLNLFNSPALLWAKGQGLSSATLSFELRREQIRDMKKALATEALVYGRLPLQITENCPQGNAGNCRGAGALCVRPAALRDRMGMDFPLLPAFGCRSEIQNSRPLYLADREDWKNLGLRYARLRFTDESALDCAALLAAHRRGGGTPPEPFTRGLFDKGVD